MEDFKVEKCEYKDPDENSIHPAYIFRMSASDLTQFGRLYLCGEIIVFVIFYKPLENSVFQRVKLSIAERLYFHRWPVHKIILHRVHAGPLLLESKIDCETL